MRGSAQLHLAGNVEQWHRQRFSASYADQHKTKCFRRKRAKGELGKQHKVLVNGANVLEPNLN